MRPPSLSWLLIFLAQGVLSGCLLSTHHCAGPGCALLEAVIDRVEKQPQQPQQQPSYLPPLTPNTVATVITSNDIMGSRHGKFLLLKNAKLPLKEIGFHTGWAVDSIALGKKKLGGQGGGKVRVNLEHIETIAVAFGKYSYSGSPISIAQIHFQYQDGKPSQIIGTAQGFTELQFVKFPVQGKPISAINAWSDGYLITGLQFVVSP